MRLQLLLGCAGLALAGVGVAPVWAGPFGGLVVFGDSLSDVGNDEALTGSLEPLVAPTPGPYYWQGRFSNGPNYVDDLSSALGLGAPSPSTLGGSDYAYGAAETEGTPAPLNLVVQDIDKQVTGYLSGHTPNATTLYDLFGGGNDLLNQLTTASPNAAPAATNIANDVNALYQKGGRQFLVLNLPLLGTIPRFNGSATESAAADAITIAFNTDLANNLAALKTSDPGIVIHELDVQSLFEQIESTPADFGLTNVTASAAPGLTAGATSYNIASEVAHPEQYLFWDDIHPTSTGYALLADGAFAAVVPEPQTLALLAPVALAALARRRRRRSRRVQAANAPSEPGSGTET